MPEPLEPLDLASRRVEGGFFLRRGVAHPLPFPTRRAAGEGFRHCFTYWSSERTIRRELEAMIAGARRKVFVASFLLGDAALHDLLVEAAGRLRGGVYVISQLDERRQRKGLADLEMADDPQAEHEAMNKRFDQMTSAGIYVRGHENLHAKFVVVDDEVALVTSANLMTRALDVTGEDGVVVTRPGEVGRLARLFARLWHEACRHEAFPGEHYTMRNLARGRWEGTVPSPRLDGSPEVIWTDGTEQYILRTIHDIVGAARRELVLASFSLKDLGKRPDILLDPVREAVGREVRVRLLVRPRASRADHMADALLLAEAGVEVLGDRETHAKAAIADGRCGALFSANFDASVGLESGVEVGCRLDGHPALGEAVRYYEHAFDQAQVRLAIRPTLQDLDRSLDAPWRTAWPYGLGPEVVASASERQHFLDAVGDEGPVLFTEPAAHRVDLHAGRGTWRLQRPAQDRPFRLAPVTTGAPPASTRLTTWFDRDSGDTSRGFCATTLHWLVPGKEKGA